jgi:hypothetical protein
MAQRRSNGSAAVRVYLEQGTHRTFAVTVDWPGWARPGRGDEAALDALAEYLPRYEIVVHAAGLKSPGTDAAGPEFTVLERVPGNATTEFGAPGVVPELDQQGWDEDAADRQARLVAACWARLDEVAAGGPAQLRKGPRGGGRDRDAVVEHVLSSDLAYARKIGVKVPPPKTVDEVRAFRDEVLATLRASGVPGAPVPAPTGRAKGWPPTYTARRIGWHALDHAWEIEDRSDPPG